MVALFVLKAYL